MIAEIRVHVGVVDAVVKTGVGHRHDDTLTAQAGPRSIDVRHVRAVPGVIDVHHVDPHRVQQFKHRTGLNPLNGVLGHEPGQSLDTDGHGGKAAAVGIEHDVGALFKAFWKHLSGEHDVDQRSLLVDEWIGCNHLEAQETSNQVGLYLVRGVHGGQTNDIKSGQAGRCVPVDVAVEAGGRHEREAVNSNGGQFVKPFAWNRERVAENVKPIHVRFTGSLRPFAG